MNANFPRSVYALLMFLVLAGSPCALLFAQTPAMQHTAEEFKKQFRTRGLKPRGLGGIVPDPPDAMALSKHSIPDENYHDLTQSHPTARAPIQFDYNSARIRAESHRELNELVAVLQDEEFRNSKMIVAGHTDSKGSAAYNRSLSERRAFAVKDYLVARGVRSERLIVRGYGEDYPIASNQTEAGRALNRRSEFILF